MYLMLSFFRRYRMQSGVMLVALLLSGLVEGVGLSALLPLLNVALKTDGGAGAETNQFEQFVVDVLHDLGISPTLGPMLLIIVVVVVLKSLLLLEAQRRVGYTAAQIGTDLRLEMLRAVLRSRWEYFLHQQVGKLTNALATEAQRASDAFVNGVTGIIFLIQGIIYGAVALAISWQASLLSVGAGALIILVSHSMVRISRQAGRKQTQLMTSLMARLTDTLQSVKPLKAMAREHLADSVLALETSRLNKALRKQVFSTALLNSAQEMMFAFFIALGIYTAIAIFNMGLVTVMVLVVTLGRSFTYFGKVQKQYQKLVQGESAYWAIRQTTDEAIAAEEHLKAGLTPSLELGIHFRDLCFAYDQTKIFTDLCLDIPARKITTLIGPSGVGKTTVIDLVIGLIQPTSGAILVDDVAMDQIDVRVWRQTIGYVPQDTVLLHDSVLHNLTLGDSALTEADAERALRQASAWDFVSELPEGIHTLVGERGGRLSGGQRQRIAIARALINRPQLLILDEATSALDPTSEREVRETLDHLRGELTVLAVSHNKGMVESADFVYEFSRDGVRLIDARC